MVKAKVSLVLSIFFQVIPLHHVPAEMSNIHDITVTFGESDFVPLNTIKKDTVHFLPLPSTAMLRANLLACL